MSIPALFGQPDTTGSLRRPCRIQYTGPPLLPCPSQPVSDPACPLLVPDPWFHSVFPPNPAFSPPTHHFSLPPSLPLSLSLSLCVCIFLSLSLSPLAQIYHLAFPTSDPVP